MILDGVLVLDEHGNRLASRATGWHGNRLVSIALGPHGWAWRATCDCCGPSASSAVFRSASAALADFESHVERRHP